MRSSSSMESKVPRPFSGNGWAQLGQQFRGRRVGDEPLVQSGQIARGRRGHGVQSRARQLPLMQWIHLAILPSVGRPQTCSLIWGHGRITDDSRGHQAPRRTLRMWAIEGAARTTAGTRRRGRPLRHVTPAGTGQEPGGAGPRRTAAALLGARRLRGHPRQWRLHRVLGRRGVRADRQALAASDLRRVQLEVRLRGGQEPVCRRSRHRQGRCGQRAQAAVGSVRRRDRVGAQRNLDRCRGARAAAGRFRRRADRDRRHLGGGWAARRRQRRRRLLLRAAEELRRRRRAVAGDLSAPPRWPASRRSRRRAAGCPTSCRCRSRSKTA